MILNNLSNREMNDQVEHALTKRGSFKVSVRAVKMDPLERAYGNYVNNDLDLAYLKVVNVASGSDIVQTECDPEAKYLQLDYVDKVSYDLEREELQKVFADFKKTSDLEKLQQAIKAVHVNLKVAEVDIAFANKFPSELQR